MGKDRCRTDKLSEKVSVNPRSPPRFTLPIGIDPTGPKSTEPRTLIVPADAGLVTITITNTLSN
jgi:hypothetical protein